MSWAKFNKKFDVRLVCASCGLNNYLIRAGHVVRSYAKRLPGPGLDRRCVERDEWDDSLVIHSVHGSYGNSLPAEAVLDYAEGGPGRRHSCPRCGTRKHLGEGLTKERAEVLLQKMQSKKRDSEARALLHKECEKIAERMKPMAKTLEDLLKNAVLGLRLELREEGYISNHTPIGVAGVDVEYMWDEYADTGPVREGLFRTELKLDLTYDQVARLVELLDDMPTKD